MPDTNREIQELLVDYADALRDGCIPTFLKSLTRGEAHRITSSGQFQETSELVRILNSIGFAEKALTPNLSLFTSRVDAKITQRLKEGRSSHGKHRTRTKFLSRTEEKTEKSI